MDTLRADGAASIERCGAGLIAAEPARHALTGTSGGAARLKLLARLRPRDVSLLAFASDGMNDKAIARVLGASAASVHHRWRMIREMLQARDRAHAVAIALTLNLIPPPQRALEMLAEHGDGDLEKVINIPATEITAFASRPT